jgi:CDP-glucose 4,6-dehydratase
MINKLFWKDKKVFITGHTGFKGSWLCIWLNHLGARVTGYALEAPTDPNMFDVCEIKSLVDSKFGDIRDIEKLTKSIQVANPDIVIHLAAQSIVNESYKNPVETYEVNAMGTVYILEAIRHCNNVRAFVNVTSDKSYYNNEWYWGYRENDPLCGYDPYSNSKSCSELITFAYRNSFFNPINYEKHGVSIASVRAGNVIGGGDWAKDRLVPDCLASLINKKKIEIRNPNAIRPWQHVLEPLSGYLELAQLLFEDGCDYAEGWNFGPRIEDVVTVEKIVDKICLLWGNNRSYEVISNTEHHESCQLNLDCSKARYKLNWVPKWSIDEAIKKTVEWAKCNLENKDMLEITRLQIINYEEIGC